MIDLIVLSEGMIFNKLCDKNEYHIVKIIKDHIDTVVIKSYDKKWTYEIDLLKNIELYFKYGIYIKGANNEKRKRKIL